MRKSVLFMMIILGGFMLNDAWAGCSIQQNCSGANEYLTIPGTAGCYECDSSRCPNGTVISATKATLEGKTYTDTMFTCHIESDGDLWRASSVPQCTKTKYTALKNDQNAHRVMINPNTGSAVSSNGGGALAVVGVEACIGYVCDAGYTEVNGKCGKPNNNCPLLGGSKAIIGHVINKNICNPTNASTGLKSTAHVKTGKVCTVECVSGGWNVTLNSDACETDYEPSADKKECVMTAAAKQRQQQQQQQQQKEKEEKERKRRENATNKELCEDSGGKWTGGTCKCDVSKNLKKEGKECVCLNDTDYKWDEASKSCKITNEAALKKACESAAATGAYMEDGKCKCQDRDKIWKGDKCIANTDIKQCKSAGGAKWDYQKNECVCNDSNMEYDSGNNKCVETKEAREKRIKNAEREASREKIADIRNKLNQLKAGLGTSVWKDREGNFNTARLASDSIAGVVLGTAGGLITSNVIKKNQIKGGFEDINCTIGGQTVAGFGDEFQVGIR